MHVRSMQRHRCDVFSRGRRLLRSLRHSEGNAEQNRPASGARRLGRLNRAIVCAGVRTSGIDRAPAYRNRALGVGYAGGIFARRSYPRSFRDQPVAKAPRTCVPDGWRDFSVECFTGIAGARAPPRGGRNRGLMAGAFLNLAAAVSISSADGAVLGACLALALATLLFIFYIQPDASDLAPHRSKLDQLMERRDTIYDNLRDLRFEFRSGKYSEGDFNAMKVSIENEAAGVLTEIERVTESQVRRARGVRAGETERGER